MGQSKAARHLTYLAALAATGLAAVVIAATPAGAAPARSGQQQILSAVHADIPSPDETL